MRKATLHIIYVLNKVYSYLYKIKIFKNNQFFFYYFKAKKQITIL